MLNSKVQAPADRNLPNDLPLAEDQRFGPAPLYVKIKRMVAQKIALGYWPCKERIPSGNELVRDLKV